MRKTLHLRLDNTTVRFTPEGSIVVVDAIRALSDTQRPERVWATLKRRHPQLGALCREYAFADKDVVSVADSDQWPVIQEKLLDHLLDREFQ
ncbi:MAG: hypothetical protein P8010_01390 [Desulfosarcinaceae bacterium]|jgi:hypothetical protein